MALVRKNAGNCTLKDHKPLIDGEYETRLVIPATNFTSAFPKAGYLGIKAIFDKNGIDT